MKEAIVTRDRDKLPAITGMPIPGESAGGEIFDGNTELDLSRCSRVLAAGKCQKAPAAIRLDRVTELHRLGVSQPDDRRGMEARADDQTLWPDADASVRRKSSTAGIASRCPRCSVRT